MARNGTERQPLAMEAAMTGILALMVDARERETRDEKSAVKSEVLLSNAGMSIEDIAVVSGKKYDAVRMAIQRARTK